MKKNIFSVLIFVLAIFALIFSGCTGQIDDVSNNVKVIPAGHIGKVLTPTGWEDKIREAGQVDLGNIGYQGKGNVLVLIEATSIALKEQFLPPDAPGNTEKTDHRLMTKGVPLEGDLYVRTMVPEDQGQRNSIFVLITPSPTQDPRVTIIHVQDIYNKFATMDVRGKTREIFSPYKDDEEVLDKLSEINKEVAAAVLNIFETNKVPLVLQNTQLSNIKPDQTILRARIDNTAAQIKANQIRTIGQAVASNPGYIEYQKWQTIKEAGIKDVTVIDNGRGSPIAIR